MQLLVFQILDRRCGAQLSIALMLRSACYAYYALAAQVYVFSPAFPDPDMRGEKKAVACALTTRQSKTSAPECPEWLELPYGRYVAAA